MIFKNFILTNIFFHSFFLLLFLLYISIIFHRCIISIELFALYISIFYNFFRYSIMNPFQNYIVPHLPSQRIIKNFFSIFFTFYFYNFFIFFIHIAFYLFFFNSSTPYLFHYFFLFPFCQNNNKYGSCFLLLRRKNIYLIIILISFVCIIHIIINYYDNKIF